MGDEPGGAAVEVIARHRLLPVVVIDDVGQAMGLASALVEASLPLAEVTLRTPAAIDAVKEMLQVRGITVGVGSVTHPSQVRSAATAGAAFLVSPGLSAALVREARSFGVPIIPGIATATELMAALDLGLSTVKFFPAEASGGRAAIEALAQPFPQARFVPTGGVSEANFLAYLGHESVVAVGGSWMVPRSATAEGRWPEVIRLSAAARQRVREQAP